MSEDKTVEVDPSELSEEVVEGLVDEGALDEETAEEYGDEVWFEEVETPEPTKREGISDQVSDAVNRCYSEWKGRSAFMSIESVERTKNDKVRLHLFHPEEGSRTVVLSLSSSVLGNLLALAKVDNPKELEGGRIMMSEGSFNRPNLVVPSNLSLYGRVRYKAYSMINQVLEKTLVERFDEDFVFGSLILTLISWLPALVAPLLVDFSTVLASLFVLPAVVLTTFFVLMFGYGVFRGVCYIVASVLKGDVTEVETRH